MSRSQPSSKKKSRNEWFECIDCKRKMLQKAKEKHACEIFDMPCIIFESKISVLLTKDCLTNPENSQKDYLKLSFETMCNLNLIIGSWCFVTSRNGIFSTVVRCLPSSEVGPGKVMLPLNNHKLASSNEDYFRVCPILTSCIETAILVKVKVSFGELGQSSMVFNSGLIRNMVRQSLLDSTIYTGQSTLLSIYSITCSLLIESWQSLESKMNNLFEVTDCSKNCEKFACVNDSSEIVIELDGNLPSETEKCKLSLSDFGGYLDLVTRLKTEIIQPLKTKQSMSHVCGIMLHGVSGVGKTFLAKCIAGELETYGASICTEIEASPQLLNKLKENQPLVYILDDLHFILSAHNKSKIMTGGDAADQNPVKVIRQFFDKLRSSVDRNVLVIGTTTDNENTDPCLRRVGYFEHEFEIPPPDQKCRFELVRKIQEKQFSHFIFLDEDLEAFSQDAHSYIASDLISVLKFASKENTDGLVSLHSLKKALRRVKPSAMKEIVLDIPHVTWSDIGGQDELKSKLKQCIEWPVKNPEKFAKFGINPPRGLLLYGPPGCSKTMIAKALANETGLNFLSVKGPEIYDKYVGQSEKAIRKLFQRARQAAPVIIFFDEIDAIASSRGNSANNNVSDRVLTQLLTELDGVEKLENVVIVAATNRPDIIDKALLRPGRIDKLFYVALPDSETRRQIVKLKIGRMPALVLNNENFVENMVRKTERFSGAEICALCDEAAMNALRRSFECSSVDDKLLESDFEQALNFVRPQTTNESLKRYETFYEHATC